MTDISNFKSEHEGYDTFYERLLDIMSSDLKMNNEVGFKIWLIERYGAKSGTPGDGSYLRSMKCLSDIYSKDLYTVKK